MKRHEAIKMISQYFIPDDLIISSTGNLSRELFILATSPNIFYMMGSMGLASSIGLGLAICCPEKRIIVIEGDGSLLMNMGSIATVGHYAPPNFVHLVLDNEAYDSTGGQPSVSDTTDLEKIAKATGYKKARRVTEVPELKETLEIYMKFPSATKGPVFVQIKVEVGGISDRIPRVPYEPEEISVYFKEKIRTKKSEI